jgi:hypothetical protein
MVEAIQAAFTPEWDDPIPDLCDGSVLADRYRIVQRMFPGWLAYDERLTRPVLIEIIVGAGTPAERVRRESSTGRPLLDAVIHLDGAFAVRMPPAAL